MFSCPSHSECWFLLLSTQHWCWKSSNYSCFSFTHLLTSLFSCCQRSLFNSKHLLNSKPFSLLDFCCVSFCCSLFCLLGESILPGTNKPGSHHLAPCRSSSSFHCDGHFLFLPASTHMFFQVLRRDPFSPLCVGQLLARHTLRSSDGAQCTTSALHLLSSRLTFH